MLDVYMISTEPGIHESLHINVSTFTAFTPCTAVGWIGIAAATTTGELQVAT